MSEIFATDSGPRCRRCEGRLWLYQQDDGVVRATCASCKAVERWARSEPVEDVRELRAEHDRVRQ